MTVVTPQGELSASEIALRRELELAETLKHLLNSVRSRLRYAGYTFRMDIEREAEDIVQETIKVAWLKRSEYDLQRGSAAGWLHGIAIKVTLSQLRKCGRLPSSIPETYQPVEPREELPVLLDRDVVETLLSRLSVKDQQLIQAFYFEGKTCKEFANEMHLELNAVRTAKHRAMKQFKVHYHATHPEEAS